MLVLLKATCFKGSLSIHSIFRLLLCLPIFVSILGSCISHCLIPCVQCISGYNLSGAWASSPTGLGRKATSGCMCMCQTRQSKHSLYKLLFLHITHNSCRQGGLLGCFGGKSDWMELVCPSVGISSLCYLQTLLLLPSSQNLLSPFCCLWSSCLCPFKIFLSYYYRRSLRENNKKKLYICHHF